MSDLSHKQQRFVSEYLCDLNATAAYKRAGYKGEGHVAEAAASRLLRNVEVAAAIAEGRARLSAQTQETAEKVTRELALLAYQRAAHLYRPDGTLKPPSEWDEAVSATISGVEVLEEFLGSGRDRKLVGHTKKVKRWDKLRALELLGRHLGMWKDKLELGGEVRQRVIEEVVDPHADGRDESEAPQSAGGVQQE